LSNDKFDFANFNVLPNPANDVITLSSKEKLESFEIIDIQGKIIIKDNFIENSINISALQTGIYFLKVIINDKFFTKKFVKN
jgi:Secretion system C-terminal sorting domain